MQLSAQSKWVLLDKNKTVYCAEYWLILSWHDLLPALSSDLNFNLIAYFDRSNPRRKMVLILAFLLFRRVD